MEVEIKTEKYLPDLEIDRIDFIREPGRSEAPDFLSQKGGDGPWTESERSWRVIQRSALLIIWVFLTFWASVIQDYQNAYREETGKDAVLGKSGSHADAFVYLCNDDLPGISVCGP